MTEIALKLFHDSLESLREKEEQQELIGLCTILEFMTTNPSTFPKARRVNILPLVTIPEERTWHLAQKSHPPIIRERVLSFWKSFENLRSTLQWEGCRHGDKRRYIAELLDRFLGKRDAKNGENLVEVFIESHATRNAGISKK